MRFAYADPPYLGLCSFYDHHHPDGRCWDEIATHVALFERLQREFSDGWAMSLHTPSLRRILPLAPEEARVCAWVKPFASFKKNVTFAYAWEPVIVCGGRKRAITEPTVRDWIAASITLRRGFTGAKPRALCFWMFEALGMRPDDEFHDLFPGSGAVTKAWRAWSRKPEQFQLEVA